MKKSSIILIIITIITVFILSTLLINNLNTNPNNVTLIQYEAGNSKQIKKINIDSVDEINKLSKFIKKIKPLNERKMINLALLKEIEITYNNNITIGIQLGEKSYCYYTDKEKNISSLSKMPNGLYEWANEKIKQADNNKEKH